ncbi:hypothetical protein J5N97_028806 [Dioscorea zingiberensis]|uniref:Uncharacterized protein n=1 Tax=Dioscorea zingiberensis TaxID=325984 RepID=A0A9D5C0D3_9LILI|nr:hypothetical protein J5N97_028806 [Dioscorea zingiberensis]
MDPSDAHPENGDGYKPPALVDSKEEMNSRGEEEDEENDEARSLLPPVMNGGVPEKQRMSSGRKVQWNDLNGNKLVEVLEFNQSDSSDSENEEDACICSILGIVVANNSEPLFHAFGFLVCLGSTAGRALKSVIQGLLLTSDAKKLNSMNFLMYMAPMVATMLLPIIV